ncbi:MAG TPA: hypothetical protein VG893_08475 [Terracidiphilus sp.]|nr:hypothetical protein [Terracidiphilus sp.]
MKALKMLAAAGALALAATPFLASPAWAADSGSCAGQGRAILTILPRKGGEGQVNLQTRDFDVHVNGKQSTVTAFHPLRGENSPLELVILIDSAARSSFGTQMGEIQSFVKEMPSHTRVAIAYMQNGQAVFTGPLSDDPAQVLKGLRLTGGVPGQSGSPYFCLSDLAKRWPSTDKTARREVVMITDGVDNYSPRFDPEDPYVNSAINDSVRAGLVVYSIYWKDTGRFDRFEGAQDAGQNNLQEVTQATGGYAYFQGYGNPVSFESYFKDLRLRFDNQYRLGFSSNLKGRPEVASLKLKVGGPAAKITAPQQVFVTPAGSEETGD